MEKKYKLTKETKKIGDLVLFRIEALKDFGIVSKGEKGSSEIRFKKRIQWILFL